MINSTVTGDQLTRNIQLGLVLLYGYNFFALIPTRLIQFAALVPCYCIVCVLLYFSPLTSMVVKE